jgi:hydroxyacylglutathione hydrolase
MLEIVPVPVLSDNYVWLVHDPASAETVAVDPSVADPVLAAAAARGWRITQVWNTHWHPDHTGGNDSIRDATGCTITGPREAERVSRMDRIVAGGDRARIGAIEAELIDIPAHTAGHVAFHLPAAATVFTGDTLFAMGCGKLFEGGPEQMYDNLQRLAALPPETRVYCGHEYTLANGLFALTVEPNNDALVRRVAEVRAARERGEVTLPTTCRARRAARHRPRDDVAADLHRRGQLLVLDRERLVGEDEAAHLLDHRQLGVDPVDRLDSALVDRRRDSGSLRLAPRGSGGLNRRIPFRDRARAARPDAAGGRHRPSPGRSRAAASASPRPAAARHCRPCR